MLDNVWLTWMPESSSRMSSTTDFAVVQARVLSFYVHGQSDVQEASTRLKVEMSTWTESHTSSHVSEKSKNFVSFLVDQIQERLIDLLIIATIIFLCTNISDYGTKIARALFSFQCKVMIDCWITRSFSRRHKSSSALISLRIDFSLFCAHWLGLNSWT